MFDQEVASTPELTPVAVAPGRPSRARWIVALAVVALVASLSVAAITLLTGRAPDATTIGWVPRDSTAYVEIRLDLPGDQRRQVGEFLSKFPGFKDQAALETKIDEVLDRLVSTATDGSRTFSRDIAPWFAGEIAFAVGPLPDPASTDGDPDMAVSSTRLLMLVSVTDAPAATAWFRDVVGDRPTRAESHAGVDLIVADHDGMTGAFGIAGGTVALLGDIASVRAAIDTSGRGGLAEDPAFRAALDAHDDDHVGFLYVNLGTYLAWAERLAEKYSGMGRFPALDARLRSLVPGWIGGRLRIESDALVVDAAFPHTDRPGSTTERESTIARHVPATTIALVEGRDVGATILRTLDLLRADPAAADPIREIETAAGILGGLDGALGWIGDLALVVDHDGENVGGGLVIVPTDAAEARRFGATIRSFAALGGSAAGIVVRDEAHGEVTITIVDLTAAVLGADLLGPGMEPPFDGPIQLAWAVTDDVVVLGSGPGFVRRILDTTAGSSLSTDERFAGLVARAGAENTGVAFIDIAAIREHIESAMADDRAAFDAYQRDVRPFLLPFDAIVQATSVDPGRLDGVRTIITVR